MQKLCLTLIWLLLPFFAFSQCLSDLKKILPRESLSAMDSYGGSVAVKGDYAFIGASQNDSTGYNTGLVYLYRNNGGTWVQEGAILAPENPDWGGFGYRIDVSENYLVVSATGTSSISPQGYVYIYKKPMGGWTPGISPIASLTVSGQKGFGSSVNISDDEEHIVVGSMLELGPSPSGGTINSGAAYVYSKSATEWTDDATYVRLTPDPDKFVFYFGCRVDIDEDYVFIGNNYHGDYQSSIHVFKADAGWSAFTSLGILHSSEAIGNTGHIGEYFTAEYGRVAAPANVYDKGITLHVFLKGTEWGQQLTEDYYVIAEAGDKISVPMSVVQTQDQIFLMASNRQVKDCIYTLTKENNSFNVTPQQLVIDDRPNGQWGGFGYSADCDGENLIMGDQYNFNLKQVAGAAYIAPINSLQLSSVQKLSDRIHTTVEHNFGSSVVAKGDFLFVGAGADGNGPLGSVSIFENVSNTWTFIKKITIPFETDFDARFGSDMAVNDNYLVVSAPWFNHDGAVFVYKRNATWADVELVSILRPLEQDGKKYQIGENVDISDDNTIVVNSHESTRFKTNALVYKLNGGSYALDQIIELGRSVGSHRREADFSFFGETLAAGCITANPDGNLLPGSVFILQKDQTGKYDTASIVIAPQESTSAFGYSVKLTEEHLFASDVFNSQAAGGNGGIYVYTMPKNGWNSSPLISTPASLITPDTGIEGDWFGWDFDVQDNIMIVGAPQSNTLANPARENYNPGNTYIIQGLDFQWNDRIQLLRYQGEFHDHQDEFGHTVTLNRNEFFIGSPYENQPDAKRSGAVYTIDNPPAVKPVRPVCVGSDVIQLDGYPFDGTWSGPGVTSDGLFDPSAAGPGKHLLTYVTPSCHYPGQLEIEIVEPPTVQWEGNAPTLCEGGTTTTQLEIQSSGESNTYQWFYKAEDADDYSALDLLGNTIAIDQPGSYYVEVSNGYCSTESGVRVVEKQTNPIVATQPAVICGDQTTTQLTAVPAGGNWTGVGIQPNGTLNVSSLSSGTFPMTYNYPTPEGCAFKKSVNVTVQRLADPIIASQGDVCNGTASIVVSNPQPGSYKYFRVGQTEDKIAEGNNKYSTPISDIGVYRVDYILNGCFAQSELLTVESGLLEIDLQSQPEGPEVCYLEDAFLSVQVKSFGAHYVWIYKETENSVETMLGTEGNVQQITRSGFYCVVVQLGPCAAVSQWKQFQISPADTVIAPNVFTPNGDDKNEFFEIQLTARETDAHQLMIFNRYGKQVFQSSADLKWLGADQAPGVYYWSLQHANCKGDMKTTRGWVQMIK